MDDEQNLLLEPPLIDLRSLKALAVLGRGAKGAVFLVRTQETCSLSGETLALKAISKAAIENKKKKQSPEDNSDGFKRVRLERDVLKMFNHPLLPKLSGEIVTEEVVGFAINYCPGGDLNSLRKKQTEKMFSDNIIRFYAAELVLALEYLHGLGIIYRDLKPENVMIQENGHLMIVDFDLSTKLSSKSEETPLIIQPTQSRSANTLKIPSNKRKQKRSPTPTFCFCNSGSPPLDSVYPAEIVVDSGRSDSSITEKSNSFVGTEDYVAPEVILGNGHDFSVDWWGLGVVLYEMLYGRTPFRGSNRKETFYRILTASPELVGEQTDLRDLIKKLLEKDPANRISVEGIKGHKFFGKVDWESILRISRPPFIPFPFSWDEDGDIKGIKEVDVELCVQTLFIGDEFETNQNNNNKGVWEEGLSNPITTADFLVF